MTKSTDTFHDGHSLLIVRSDEQCVIRVADIFAIGWKSDFSKYFDSVPIRFIDEAFNAVEVKWGRSTIKQCAAGLSHIAPGEWPRTSLPLPQAWRVGRDRPC